MNRISVTNSVIEVLSDALAGPYAVGSVILMLGVAAVEPLAMIFGIALIVGVLFGAGCFALRG